MLFELTSVPFLVQEKLFKPHTLESLLSTYGAVQPCFDRFFMPPSLLRQSETLTLVIARDEIQLQVFFVRRLVLVAAGESEKIGRARLGGQVAPVGDRGNGGGDLG